jgi:hypothetical protein
VAMANIQDIKRRAQEADIPLRELGSRSGIVYSRVCDAFKGWVTLRDKEIVALESAVNAALRERAEKFNKMLAGSPAAETI